MTMTKPLKIAVWLLALLLLGMMAAPYLRTAQEKSRRCSCNGHLKITGLGLRMYSTDHTNQFPRTLDALVSYGIEPYYFVCPSTKHKAGSVTNCLEWSDYVYIQGLDESDPGNVALIIEKPGNHQGAGGNVLFVDGHVEWFSEDVLRALLKEPRLARPEKARGGMGAFQ